MHARNIIDVGVKCEVGCYSSVVICKELRFQCPPIFKPITIS